LVRYVQKNGQNARGSTGKLQSNIFSPVGIETPISTYNKSHSGQRKSKVNGSSHA